MRILGKKTCIGQIDIIRNEIEELVELPALSGRYIIKRGEIKIASFYYMGIGKNIYSSLRR